MKKLIVLLLALLLAPSALGQSVGASQIKKRAAGGLVADPANALTVAVHRNSAPPSSPVEGQLWCDTTTTPCSMKTYSGSAWTSSPNTAVMTQATLASLPGSPVDGQIVWVSSQRRAIVYVASEALWYYLDATGSTAQADYSIDTVGFSTDFLSSPGSTTGSLVSGGSMTAGAHSCAITHYNSTGGETMVGGTYTATVPGSGNRTMALAFAATGTGVAGKRVYCSKANTTTPLLFIATINDTTTGAYNVTIDDSAFKTNAAPDKDFSAPIPAGWAFYSPDLTYGGCGSTGTTLLCSLVKVITNTNSATSAGVRLFYPISGDPLKWRASWRITRLLGGFPGGTSNVYGWGPVATISADAAAVAPVMASMFAYKDYTGALYPWSSTWNPMFHAATRTVNAAWDSTPVNSRPTYPPIATTSAFVLVRGTKDGSNYSVIFSASQNGVDFAGAYTNANAAQNSANWSSCTSGSWCGATKPAYVGIGIESLANNSNTMTGMVYELADFRWKSE